MNGDARKIGIMATVAAATLALCGCMSDPTTATTPISQRMAAAVAAPAGPPSFAAVPPKPTDLRKPEEWRIAVGEEEAMRARIVAETAPETFALKGDTEAFAARGRAEATNEAPAAPTAADRQATEDYAASLRQQASQPSSPR